MHLHLVEDYKKMGFSQGLISLWSGKLLLDFGLNIFGLFLPIIFYQEFGSYTAVVLWWMAHSLGYVLWLPLSAQWMNRIGIRNCLILGVLFRIPYFYAWYSFSDNPVLWATVAAISLVLLRGFFWLPFQTDSAKFSSKKNRGKQFSVIFSLGSLLSIIAPVIGGFLMDKWGLTVLSIVSLLVAITSIVPFWFLPQTKEQVTWKYKETFKYFFHPFNRRMVVAYMSDGAVGIVNGVFWPLFIFTVMDEKFKAVGLITGGILLAGVVVRLMLGGMLDKFQKVKLVKVGTILNSTAWLIKVAVSTALHIFLTSIYHTMALIVLRTSLDTLIYERAADRGHYIDEYTLIKEMAMHAGKIIILLVIAGLLVLFPIQATFILAAVVAMFITLLK